MKKLLLILTLLAGFASGISASSYCYWGYATSTVVSQFGSKTAAKGAIYIPAEVAQRYNGCTISKVRVGLAAKTTTLTVFVTKNLDDLTSVSGTTTTAYKGQTEVKTTQPYTIDGEGFYVGYTYDGEAESMGASNVYDANGCWADLGDGWKNYAVSSQAKALNIDAVITGDNLPVDARLVALNGALAREGEAFSVTGVVKNQGPSRISSLQLAYSIDGAEEQTTEVSKLVVTAGSDKTFSFDVAENPYKPGIHVLSVRVVSVGGEPDTVADNNTATARLNITGGKAVKRMVVEEGTGTGCGYCPRGIVGIERMYANHPGQFIGIAAHTYSSTALACPEEYQTFAASYFSGYPTCRVQRLYTSDPRSGALENYFAEVTEKLNIGVEVAASLSADGKSIEATSSVTPLAVAAGTEYRLAFVVTEDDVTGYRQANNYAGGSYGSMGGWENRDSYAAVDLQHVARATYGLFGIEGSLPATLTENETIERTQSLEIPSDVQTKTNLNVVVLVLNMVTGEIENAAECRVGSSSTAAGIAPAEASLAPDVTLRAAGGTIIADGFKGSLEVYRLDGTTIANRSLPHGIYIVKGTDNRGRTFVRRIAL